MQYRKQFRLNDVITFELGSRFLVLDELDNEGQSVQRLVTGPELGEDGGTNYRFNATLRIDDANDESHYNDGNQPMGTALMDALIEKNPDVRTWRINGRPAAQFLSKKTPINLGGSILKLYMIGIQVPMTSSSAVTFFQVVVLSEDSDENQQHFQDLVDAAKTIRVSGKALNLNGASAAILMEELLPDFQEGEEGVLNLQMGVKVKVGDGEATRVGTITYNRDGSTGFESDDDDDDVSWDDDHDDDDDDD
ncbi:MAG: hypothetical protein J6K55_08505, partial [Clostridia bacterium]|nr:hypothetical protein [Clostridia bacterium]